MGWKWSLWCAQKAHESQARKSGLPDETRIMDRLTCPKLTRNSFASAIYVDNFLICSHDPEVASFQSNKHINNLETNALPCHEIEDARAYTKFAGLDFDGIELTVRIYWKRIWRIKFAIDYILSLPTLTGEQLESVLGHITWVVMVRREALSLIHAC